MNTCLSNNSFCKFSPIMSTKLLFVHYLNFLINISQTVYVKGCTDETLIDYILYRQGHSTANSLEGCKFKLLMKLQLTDIHLVGEEHDSYSSASACATGAAAMCGKSVQGPSSSATSSSHHSDELDDLKTIQKMMDLANLLKCPHVGLDEVLRELASGLKHHCDNNADILDIEIKAGENRLVLLRSNYHK